MDRTSRWRSVAPITAVIWISAETMLVARLETTHRHVVLLSAALAIDIALVVATTLWLVRPIQISPRTVLRGTALALLGIGVLARVTDLGPSARIVRVSGVIVDLALTASAAWLLLDRRESSSATTRLARILPAPLAAALVGEVELLLAAIRAPTRVRAQVVNKRSYPTMEGSRTGWVVPFVIIVSVVELAAVHLLLWRFGHSMVLHAVVLGLHAYGIVWLIGDRRLMAESAHRVGEHSLHVHVGARLRIEIPFDAVEQAMPVADPLARHRVQPKRGRNPRATPGDAANVHLCLRRTLTGSTYFGIRRTVRHLDLFVARPGDLLGVLAEQGIPISPV